MLHIISLRAQISQNMNFWYEICDVLVPIFHSVKFAKCEICCSTGYVLKAKEPYSDRHFCVRFQQPFFIKRNSQLFEIFYILELGIIIELSAS